LGNPWPSGNCWFPASGGAKSFRTVILLTALAVFRVFEIRLSFRVGINFGVFLSLDLQLMAGALFQKQLSFFPKAPSPD